MNFNVRINGGPEKVLRTKTSIYAKAAAAAFAMITYEERDGPDVIEIWCEKLDHLFYAYDGMGNLASISAEMAKDLLDD